jgi:hypothetical protein
MKKCPSSRVGTNKIIMICRSAFLSSMKTAPKMFVKLCFWTYAVLISAVLKVIRAYEI